jgi:hypothetical protein
MNFQQEGVSEVTTKTSVADPGSGAFLPPGSGIRIRDEFFPDPGSKGYVFGEIFLRILVL